MTVPRICLAFALCLALAGCLDRGGIYDPLGLRADHISKPVEPSALREQLEAQIRGLERKRQKVPLGMYANLGIMYYQAKMWDKAVANFRREREEWPEGGDPLLDKAISNILAADAARGTD